MRQREVDQEARQDRQQLGGENRNPIRQDDEHRSIGDHAGNTGRDEGAVVAQAQLLPRLGGERDEGVHHVGAGDRDQPSQHVGGHQGEREDVVGDEKDAEVDQRVDHADHREARRLERYAALPPRPLQAIHEADERRGQVHGGTA